MLALWPFRRISRRRIFRPEEIPTDSVGFTRAMEVAGFFVSHAVWCISSGESLGPLIGCESTKGWYLLRMLDEEVEAGAERGKQWIDTNPERAERAVLIYDAYRTIAGLKTDALVSILIEYEPERRHLEVVLPYRHAAAEGGFAVHRPKFRDRAESGGATADLTEAFFRGSDLHAQGAAIWHSCLDESR